MSEEGEVVVVIGSCTAPVTVVAFLLLLPVAQRMSRFVGEDEEEASDIGDVPPVVEVGVVETGEVDDELFIAPRGG